MQARFTDAYLKSGNAAAAALEAGYARRGAGAAASRLLKNSQPVKEIVTAARQAIVAKGAYNIEMAMKEADEAIAFAIETENANAYVKALELKSKLNGLLVEKHDFRMSGFVINMSGIDDPVTEATEVVSTVSPPTEEDLFS